MKDWVAGHVDVILVVVADLVWCWFSCFSICGKIGIAFIAICVVEWRKKVEHRARQGKKTSGKLHRILESDKSGRLISLSGGCVIGGCSDVCACVCGIEFEECTWVWSVCCYAYKSIVPEHGTSKRPYLTVQHRGDKRAWRCIGTEQKLDIQTYRRMSRFLIESKHLMGVTCQIQTNFHANDSQARTTCDVHKQRSWASCSLQNPRQTNNDVHYS